jgi:hypothetical protein
MAARSIRLGMGPSLDENSGMFSSMTASVSISPKRPQASPKSHKRVKGGRLLFPIRTSEKLTFEMPENDVAHMYRLLEESSRQSTDKSANEIHSHLIGDSGAFSTAPHEKLLNPR